MLLIAIVGFVLYQRQQNETTIPEGTLSFNYAGAQHSTEPVTYTENPPVGGVHNPTWQNCGYYAAPIANETPFTPWSMARSGSPISPTCRRSRSTSCATWPRARRTFWSARWRGFPRRWSPPPGVGRLQLESADDPRLDQFVRRFRLSPEAPEPGAACSGGTSATLVIDPAALEEAPPRRHRARRVIGRWLPAFLALSRWPPRRSSGLVTDRPPDDTSLEAGFARDMMVHHDQAVAMALLARDRTRDPLIETLTTDIVLTQQNQIGQMLGWLNLWGLPATGAEPPMAWMGHPTEGRMPGMASPEEMAALESLSGEAADIAFLRLMIRHHQGRRPHGRGGVGGATIPPCAPWRGRSSPRRRSRSPRWRRCWGRSHEASVVRRRQDGKTARRQGREYGQSREPIADS